MAGALPVVTAKSQATRAARGLLRRAMAALPADGPAVDEIAPDRSSASSMLAWAIQRRPESASRSNYLWCTLKAAIDARGLKLSDISAVEFGVAGGNGLLALERAATVVEELVGVTVHVYGFDTGTGMPPPAEHRDLPWAVKPGYFAWDEPELRRRLTRAELVVGPVGDTVASWAAAGHPPVGFASFDLDYYSSTVDAFRLLDAGPDALLPRVISYFDDILGPGWTEYVGEREAIAEFNASHEHRKIAEVYGLKYELPESEWRSPWHEQIYIAHLFDHPRYDDTVFEPSAAWLDAHQLR
jgi:hypothetical protein